MKWKVLWTVFFMLLKSLNNLFDRKFDLIKKSKLEVIKAHFKAFTYFIFLLKTLNTNFLRHVHFYCENLNDVIHKLVTFSFEKEITKVFPFLSSFFSPSRFVFTFYSEVLLLWINLLVQNLGSSLPSPQSSRLSQYAAAEMHLLLAQENSLIEHFWLTPVDSFVCCDCLTLWIVTMAVHTRITMILIFLVFIFEYLFKSLLLVFLPASIVLRLNLYCFEHFCVRIIDHNSETDTSEVLLYIYLHFVTSLSLLGLLLWTIQLHALLSNSCLQQIAIYYLDIEKREWKSLCIMLLRLSLWGLFLISLSVSRFPLDLCMSRMWRDFQYFFFFPYKNERESHQFFPSLRRFNFTRNGNWLKLDMSSRNNTWANNFTGLSVTYTRKEIF